MPNLWSKAGQFISEAISGAKTKDEALRIITEKMNNTEIGINNIKNLLHSYNSWTDPFCKYIKDFTNSLKLIYKDTPYEFFIEKVFLKYELIVSEIDQLNKTVSKLYSKTSAWDQIFIQAKDLKKIREEKRKNFEHYEQKLKKINKDLKKQKDTELVKRNEEKYKIAAAEYFDISEKTFDTISDSMKLSWGLVDPIITELVSTEKNSFNDLSVYLDSYQKLYDDFKKEEDKVNKANFYSEGGVDLYDPTKYVNSKTLIKKTFSINKNKNNKKMVRLFSANNFKNRSYNGSDKNEIKFFVRNTNTFGKVPEDRKEQFLAIIDCQY